MPNQRLAIILTIVTTIVASPADAQVPSTNAANKPGKTELTFSCRPENDLFAAVTEAGTLPAVAATGDAKLREAEDRLADFLVRIQVRSEKVPCIDGTWFRAFDFGRWDYWASSADMGWGAWCIESGWGPAGIPVVFGLREKNTSLWEFTASSQIAQHMGAVDALMKQNDGRPYVAK